MDKIVIAFGNDNNGKRIADILENAGYNPKKLCRTGKEVIRVMRSMGGGLVICGYSLPDMTADNLCYDIGGMGAVLVIAQISMLDLCENKDIHKIASPLRKNELLYMVNSLLEEEEKRLSSFKNERSNEDNKIILEAKEVLMNKLCISEAEAHKHIQKMSMDMRVRFVAAAQSVLEKYRA